MLKNLFWKAVAWVVTIPFITEWLIRRAQDTPYFHLPGYMDRWWEWNPYDHDTHIAKYKFLPSIRLHHILRADRARHLHDHPWDARTIILKGDYVERKLKHQYWPWDPGSQYSETYKYNRKERGDTGEILYGEYHSIDEVSEGGVWTLFITFGYKGMWGFLVDGVKMPWREYESKYPT